MTESSSVSSRPTRLRDVQTDSRGVLGSSRASRGLPADLLQDASRRLGIMSLVGAVIWLMASGLDHLALREMSHGKIGLAEMQVSDAIAGASVLVSVAVFLYTRKSARDPRLVLDLGLAYMVLTA